MKKLFVVLLAIVFVFAASFVAPQKTAAKDNKPLVLFDFETDAEIAGIFKENNDTKDYPIEKVTENVTSGKFAMKVTFPDKGDWPGPHFLKFKNDWSAYDLLKMDVFNPQKEIVALNFAGADADAGFTTENYFGDYGKRFHSSFILKPGKNTIELELTGATTEDKERAVNLKNIKRFAFFLGSRPKGCVLFFDNMRLEKAEE
jgi:hypothetical protein